jgi:hypothetical protein
MTRSSRNFAVTHNGLTLGLIGLVSTAMIVAAGTNSCVAR